MTMKHDDFKQQQFIFLDIESFVPQDHKVYEGTGTWKKPKSSLVGFACHNVLKLVRWKDKMVKKGISLSLLGGDNHKKSLYLMWTQCQGQII